MIRRGSGFIVETSSNSFLAGTKCVVCRVDRSTGFFWLISVDLAKKDESYRTIEFGPFCAADIPAGKLRRAKVRIPRAWEAELHAGSDLRGKFERRPNSTG